MRLIRRSSWGARYGRGPTNITPGRGGVAVHYEGSGKLTGHAHTGCAGRVRAIESFHRNTRGWDGIAYSFLVCEHGYVFEGRGLGRRTAANGTTAGNQSYYAVCALIGDKDPVNDTLLSGMRDAIDYMRSHGAGRALKGHRQFLATECPGSRLVSWVTRGAPRPGGSSAPSPTPPKPTPSQDWLSAIVADLTTVRRGSKGRDVSTVQGLVCARGADIDIDGVFGPNTDRRVREEQQKARVTVDGIVGRTTWRVLITGRP